MSDVHRRCESPGKCIVPGCLSSGRSSSDDRSDFADPVSEIGDGLPGSYYCLSYGSANNLRCRSHEVPGGSGGDDLPKDSDDLRSAQDGLS